nr:MAG TPA: hypothetical protein [Caudoviricetes sp.]
MIYIIFHSIHHKKRTTYTSIVLLALTYSYEISKVLFVSLIDTVLMIHKRLYL